MKFSFHRTRPALSSQARWMPFELLVALRFLREGRMQSALILAGVTGGVAVIIFLTQLINQLQGTIIDKVLGSQAHVVIKPLEEATQRVVTPRADQAVAALVQPREQRLRSVDQWERIAALAAATPGVLAVSPVVSGPAFAARGNSNKSVVLLGVQPARPRCCTASPAGAPGRVHCADGALGLGQEHAAQHPGPARAMTSGSYRLDGEAVQGWTMPR
jgi:lipoprotein-releasing system permease protein